MYKMAYNVILKRMVSQFYLLRIGCMGKIWSSVKTLPPGQRTYENNRRRYNAGKRLVYLNLTEEWIVQSGMRTIAFLFRVPLHLLYNWSLAQGTAYKSSVERANGMHISDVTQKSLGYWFF